MPQDRTESHSGQGLGWLGLSIVGIVVSLTLSIVGLIGRYSEELDPCINEELVRCPPGPGWLFIAAAGIGAPALVGLAVTLRKRLRD